MASAERSTGQKFVDNLFHGTPHNIFTSDEGMRLKYLQDIQTTLSKHQETVERSLRPSTSTVVARERAPEYMPTPEIIINTDRLADAQYHVSEKLEDVIDAQRMLISVATEQTPLFQRMVRNQGVSNELLAEGNEINIQAAMSANQQRILQISQLSNMVQTGERMVRNQGVSNELLAEGNEINIQAAIHASKQRDYQINQLTKGNEINMQAALMAFRQRNTQIDQLSNVIAMGKGIIAEVSDVGMTIERETTATRELLQQFFTDIGSQIMVLTNEQVIARMSLLQVLYRIRSTFIQSHEQVMMSHQKQTGILVQILEAARMTEGEKESRYQWKMAEKIRKEARSHEDFSAALAKLQEAYRLDELNPSVYLSVGTIQSTLGYPELAAVAFAKADDLLANAPNIDSYALMNLANNLLLLAMPEHAERVMRKATIIDKQNREVWFLYAKTAWKAGKKDAAIQVMKTLLELNSSYYKAQIFIDDDFAELSSILFPSKQ